MANTQKRVPKNDITFKVSLSSEQKQAKEVILNNKITVVSGIAGTSKTFTAVQTALDQFFKRQVNKITIMRPTVATEDLGALPGTVKEKMEMWMIPIIENMYILYDKAKIDKMIVEGDIRMLPLQFTQGITFVDEFVILDEAQNATVEQIAMVLTRLGKTSTMVLTGDENQIQLKNKSLSGLKKLILLESRIEKLGHVRLTSNHRDAIVEEIVNLYVNGI
jgi:phosphate starvation-inducible PhoH-like protein